MGAGIISGPTSHHSEIGVSTFECSGVLGPSIEFSGVLVSIAYCWEEFFKLLSLDNITYTYIYIFVDVCMMKL